MSADLSGKIQLALDELARVREQISPLISKSPGSAVTAIETAAACAMLHSSYTGIEKILVLIAREWDGQEPSGAAWHRALLTQMADATTRRPAVITAGLVEVLEEFLAFRLCFADRL